MPIAKGAVGFWLVFLETERTQSDGVISEGVVQADSEKGEPDGTYL